jgi:hypothetical protein
MPELARLNHINKAKFISFLILSLQIYELDKSYFSRMRDEIWDPCRFNRRKVAALGRWSRKSKFIYHNISILSNDDRSSLYSFFANHKKKRIYRTITLYPDLLSAFYNANICYEHMNTSSACSAEFHCETSKDYPQQGICR